MTFEWDLVLTVARRELHDTVRARLLWIYAGAFGVLASALTLSGLAGNRLSGTGGYGRTAASLVALAQTMVPLMGLTLGALTLAGARERGALRFVLAHPVSRTEVLVGTFLGLAGGLFGAVAAGFGVAGLIGAVSGAPGSPMSLLALTGLAALLAVSMVAVGMAIGAGSVRSSSALGFSVLAWLLLVFAGDLGIMGTALATRMPVSALLFSVIANPVEAFRIAAVPTFGSSLDILGPAGSYAIDTLGPASGWLAAVVLVVWIVGPGWVGLRRFRRCDA